MFELEKLQCSDMGSKYDCIDFCSDFASSCNDIGSKYDSMLEDAVHVRHIVAGHPRNSNLGLIIQHETRKVLRSATIWALSMNRYRNPLDPLISSQITGQRSRASSWVSRLCVQDARRTRFSRTRSDPVRFPAQVRALARVRVPIPVRARVQV